MRCLPWPVLHTGARQGDRGATGLAADTSVTNQLRSDLNALVAEVQLDERAAITQNATLEAQILALGKREAQCEVNVALMQGQLQSYQSQLQALQQLVSTLQASVNGIDSRCLASGNTPGRRAIVLDRVLPESRLLALQRQNENASSRSLRS